MKLRFLSSGESHGPELNIIVEGLPADLEVLVEDINVDLKRRQGGYGRGGRMKIEKDKVIFTGGIRHGRSFGGAPIAMKLINKDHQKWLNTMSADPVDENDEEVKAELEAKFISKVRPGHADYAGALKYNAKDVRDILERSSARETTSRVAVGALCKKFLKEFGIEIFSHVKRIGKYELSSKAKDLLLNMRANTTQFIDFKNKVEASDLRIFDTVELETEVKEYINATRKAGDTLGGLLEINAFGVPVGLGSHVQWDRRLDGRIAQALMSVHTVKSVEIGIGQEVANEIGSVIQDQFRLKENYDPTEAKPDLRYIRPSNRLGGIEGGMSNGETIVCSAAVKPIPTLVAKLDSVDLATKTNSLSHFERSDVCVVPAAGVVLEAMLAFSIAESFLEKFGGDSMSEIKNNYNSYMNALKQR